MQLCKPSGSFLSLSLEGQFFMWIPSYSVEGRGLHQFHPWLFLQVVAWCEGPSKTHAWILAAPLSSSVVSRPEEEQEEEDSEVILFDRRR